MVSRRTNIPYIEKFRFCGTFRLFCDNVFVFDFRKVVVMRLSKGASLAGIIAITENLFSMPSVDSVSILTVRIVSVLALLYFCDSFFNSK